MKLNTIPLLDNFETTLAQEWDGQVGKMKVNELPNIPVNNNGKFRSGMTTFVIVNPDKTSAQLVEIDGYNTINKTLNVIRVGLAKWDGVNYSSYHHNQKSIVRISNNFAFWKELREVINSKWDYGNGNITSSWDFILDIKKGALKLKDRDNSAISLTEISEKIWKDKKVALNKNDTTGYLDNKLHFSWGLQSQNQSWVKNVSLNLENTQQENNGKVTINSLVFQAIAGENIEQWKYVRVGVHGILENQKTLGYNDNNTTNIGMSIYKHSSRRWYTYQKIEQEIWTNIEKLTAIHIWYHTAQQENGSYTLSVKIKNAQWIVQHSQDFDLQERYENLSWETSWEKRTLQLNKEVPVTQWMYIEFLTFWEGYNIYLRWNQRANTSSYTTKVISESGTTIYDKKLYFEYTGKNYSNDTTWRIYKAESGILPYKDGIWFAKSSVTEGGKIFVVTDGVVNGFSGLTVNAYYKLNGKWNIVKQNAKNSDTIAKAISTNTILISKN